MDPTVNWIYIKIQALHGLVINANVILVGFLDSFLKNTSLAPKLVEMKVISGDKNIFRLVISNIQILK